MPGVLRLAEQEIQQAAADSDCRTGQDIAVPLPAGFKLDCGAVLDGAELLIRVTGPAGAPLIAVSGGISANRFVCDYPSGKGWWSAFVAPGAGIDLSQYRVLGFDFLPGETAGIAAITTGDQARALVHALDFIGEQKLHAFVGSSFGGMVGLALAAEYPHLLGRLCVISGAHRAHPMATAIRGIQRRILKLAMAQDCPEEGVALARQLAMTTYRTADEFQKRFTSDPRGKAAGDAYDVCEYLISRGEDFASKMPIERLLLLSDAMDRHRVDPGRITVPTLVIGVTSDRLVPLEDLRALAATLAGPVEIVELQSTFGHDAFLLEVETLLPLLTKFCQGVTP
jgi:homoserine O-acetyltransferase